MNEKLNQLVKEWLQEEAKSKISISDDGLYQLLLSVIDKAVVQHTLIDMRMSASAAANHLGINRSTMTKKTRLAGYKLSRRITK